MSEMPESNPVITSSENAGMPSSIPAPLPSESNGENLTEDLTPPSHDEEKVQIVNPDDDNDSIVPVTLTKQVIEVIADRKGFYGQQRIAKGQLFSIAKEADFGEWMICTDPEMEKKRKQFFKIKKAQK